MANRQIRRIVQYLLDQGPTRVELDTLVEVLTREDATADGERRERLAIDLHHRRLPQLSDTGFLDYDARTNTVDYGPSPRETRILRALVGE